MMVLDKYNNIISKEEKNKLWAFLSFLSFSIVFFGGLALINVAIAGFLLTFITYILAITPAGSYLKRLWTESIVFEAHITLFGISIILIIIFITIFIKGWRVSIKLEKK
jgi:amino acid permease